MQEFVKKLQKFRDISVKLSASERFEDAEKMCVAALEMLESSSFANTEGARKWSYVFNSMLADIAMSQRDYPKALHFYTVALEIQASLPKSAAFSFALDNLAKVYKALGDNANAQACKLAALENLEEFAPESKNLIAKRYFELARDYEESGRAAEAIEIKKKANKLAQA